MEDDKSTEVLHTKTLDAARNFQASMLKHCNCFAFKVNALTTIDLKFSPIIYKYDMMFDPEYYIVDFSIGIAQHFDELVDACAEASAKQLKHFDRLDNIVHDLVEQAPKILATLVSKQEFMNILDETAQIMAKLNTAVDIKRAIYLVEHA